MKVMSVHLGSVATLSSRGMGGCDGVEPSSEWQGQCQTVESISLVAQEMETKMGKN